MLYALQPRQPPNWKLLSCHQTQSMQMTQIYKGQVPLQGQESEIAKAKGKIDNWYDCRQTLLKLNHMSIWMSRCLSHLAFPRIQWLKMIHLSTILICISLLQLIIKLLTCIISWQIQAQLIISQTSKSSSKLMSQCWRPLSKELVGGMRSQVLGRGTITLIAKYGMYMHTLNLENVNYIPLNKHNIFALGRWDNNRRKYQASGSKLTLMNRQGIPVLKGPKITSNIYKFH